jgi:hypothetical protein
MIYPVTAAGDLTFRSMQDEAWEQTLCRRPSSELI